MSAFDIRNLLDAVDNARPRGNEAAMAAASPAETAGRKAGPRRLSTSVLAGCVRGGEFVGVAALGILIHRLQLDEGGRTTFWHLGATLGVASLAVCLVQVAGGYRMTALRSSRAAAPGLTMAWLLTFLVVGLVGLATRADHQTIVWMASYLAIGLAALLGSRVALARLVAALIKAGRFDRRTAIVGTGGSAEELIRSLDAETDSGISIVGVFDDRGDDRSGTVVAGHPKLGTVGDIDGYVRSTQLDLVVLTIPLSAEDRILQMLGKLWVLPIEIRLSAQATKLRLRPRAYSFLGTVPVLDVLDKPMSDWDVVAKGVFDRAVGLAMLVALGPLMLGIAIAVRLTSPGPALFRQKRLGFNNEVIEVCKFRSMYASDADQAAFRQVTRGDPRVTPLGRILRSTSLDELPQLFNVLRGELSLVGPRPHVVQGRALGTPYEQVVDGYFARHKVKPGLTGWAQINGWRGETDTWDKIRARVDHDLHYIENWSMLFDIRIMLATPAAIIRSKNAY